MDTSPKRERSPRQRKAAPPGGAAPVRAPGIDRPIPTPRAVMDSMLDPHAVLTPVDRSGMIVDFTIDEANDAAMKDSVGLTGPVLGRRLTDAMPEAAALIPALAQVMQSGGTVDRDDLVAAHPGQPTRHVHLRAVRDGSRLRLTWRDVTDQHDTTRRLGDLQERYRLLVEHSGALIVATDERATITGVSPAVINVLGWHPADLLGRPLAEFTHPGDTGDLAPMDGSASPAVAPRPVRLRVHRGAYRWFTMSSIPLHSGDDSLKRLVLAHPRLAEDPDSDAPGST